MIALSRQRPERPEWTAARAAVLEAARALIAAGEEPSARAIAERTGMSRPAVQRWRGELVDLGALQIEPVKPGPRKAAPTDGLLGESPEEQREIEARIAAARSGKVGLPQRGETVPQRTRKVCRYVGPELRPLKLRRSEQ